MMIQMYYDKKFCKCYSHNNTHRFFVQEYHELKVEENRYCGKMFDNSNSMPYTPCKQTFIKQFHYVMFIFVFDYVTIHGEVCKRCKFYHSD